MRIVGAAPAATLARRPAPKSWSPTEIVCHLRDVEELFQLRFHTILFQATHNELLEHMTALVGSVLRMLFMFSSRPPITFERALPLHGSILDAIRARDPDAAEIAVLRLIDDTERNVERALVEMTGEPLPTG